MLDQLYEINNQVTLEPHNIPPDIVKTFWGLVGKIKRTPTPNENEIIVASKIRDTMYAARFGRTLPTKLMLPLWCLLGFGFGLGYHRILTHSDSLVFYLLRFFMIFGIITFFYPPGRYLAGRVMGIHFDGLVRDPYFRFEPTFKVNYQSYLRASPPNRMWFFFIAGVVPTITGLIAGILGLWVKGDLIGIVVAGLLGLYAILGVFGHTKAGEMANYQREQKIVQDWLRNKEQLMGT